MTEDVEVIVIGAGAAGLAAARELSLAGRSVVVLEARERIGGRINTHFDRWPIELGAELVHGKPPETLTIVESFLEGLLEDVYTHNWQKDPFAAGAYSYIPVGGIDAQTRLARPLNGTLFFAGEATNTEGHQGTVHGAIASGLRAAGEILGHG